MDAMVGVGRSRRPRFRRASEPPVFRLTDDDVEIIRQVARFRFIRSTHIAGLVNRSVDRTNERLRYLFDAGYVDRPRAQLDYYPTGSAPMVYALADRGVRLLIERDGTTFRNGELTRNNRRAHRPFIEHQIEIVNFRVALDRAVRERPGLTLLSDGETIAPTRYDQHSVSAAISFRASIFQQGMTREYGVIPDYVFALEGANGKRRNFAVEIDRGTMPVVRSDITQTSFSKKMHTYLAAHATKLHQRKFGWDTFRVLTLTTDPRRLHSMVEALQHMNVPGSAGGSLFLFSTFRDFGADDPLSHEWLGGNGRTARLR